MIPGFFSPQKAGLIQPKTFHSTRDSLITILLVEQTRARQRAGFFRNGELEDPGFGPGGALSSGTRRKLGYKFQVRTGFGAEFQIRAGFRVLN